MLGLQRLTLRNRLQIVVTTHSPTVLETVPTEGRVFLERNPENVVRREPYRDLIQDEQPSFLITSDSGLRYTSAGPLLPLPPI